MLGELLEPVNEGGDGAETGEALGEDHVHHCEQEPRVGTGNDRQVLVGDRGRLGAPGVDDDEAPAPGLELADPVAHPGRRHQAAVGRERVAAEAEEELGAVDVGHREHGLVAEELVGRELLRELIERGRGEPVAGPQRGDEREDEELRPEMMDGRIAGVETDGIVAVRALDGADARGDVVERVVPVDALPAVRRSPQGKADPVRIVMQVLERRSLGTDVATRERVLAVPPDREDVLAGVPDLESAHRLAQRARPEVHVRGSRHDGDATPRSGVGRGHVQFVLADANDVTGMQLPAAARLELPVDRHGLGREEGLDLGAAVDHPSELEELPEPDHLAANGHVEHRLRREHHYLM
jgi:hypothetical protein